MTSYTERYLQAVLAHLPENQKIDVGRELRGLIADTVDAHVAAGRTPEQAEIDTLNDLGDPAALARSYGRQDRWLIGPRWFPAYLTFLKTVGIGIVVILALLTMALALVDGESMSRVLVQGLSTVYEVATQVLLWTTVTFAIIERSPEAARSLEPDPWTVANLPEPQPERQIGITQSVLDIGTAVALGAFALIQARSGVGAFIRGQDDKAWIDLPVFNPNLGTGVVVGFWVLILVSIVAAVVRVRVGRWTTTTLAVTIVEAVIWIGFTGVVAYREAVFNPALGEALDPGATWWEAGSPFNQVLFLGVTVFSLTDVWDGIKHLRNARNQRHLASTIA